MTENKKESFWKSPNGIIIKSLGFSALISGSAFLIVLLAGNDGAIKAMFWVLYYLAVFFAAIFFFYGKLFKDTKEEIIEITRTEIEDKIYRKLVSTNAIIEQPNKKLSVTAKILNDFPDERFYKDKISDPSNTTTIDVVRFLSYQDFLFTPKYLKYLFYRHNNSKETRKIIVVSTEDCQATLSYLFICCKLGYKTKIISTAKFKEFFIKYCNSDEEKLRMIKGNPFMYEMKHSTTTYGGEFTNYQKNLTNNGEIMEIKNEKPNWDLLNSLFNEPCCIEISESDIVTATSISDILAPTKKKSIT